LLAKIFTEQEADLAAELRVEMETPAGIAERLGRDLREVSALLKEMTKKGLISFGKTVDGRLGFGSMPFVVGIYEEQVHHMDPELARLFEDYYQRAFGNALKIEPQVHRVIPVRESISNTMEIRPFESITSLLESAQSWGVIDCICRKQKALIGEGCDHPVDVCMMLNQKPGAFKGAADVVRDLTLEEARQTIQRAADAGLVHCVSNHQEDVTYICNCCTCSCAILRGMAELGIANAVAHSAFINRVNEELCIACGDCVSACPFHALTLEITAQVLEISCTGCGVCISSCPQGALALERRAEATVPPVDEKDWREERMLQR
jgi:Na+-translocating ferredoxin:NAD+ oxidoreductase RNF subunit RnfB